MKAVLLTSGQGFDPARVGSVLSAFQKIPLSDAVHKARQSWGLVAESMPDSEAQALVQAFSTAGLAVHAIDPTQLRPLPAARPVASLTLSPSSMSLTLQDKSQSTLLFKDLFFAAAAQVDISHFKTVTKKEGPSAAQKIASAGILLATGIPLSIGPKEKTVEKRKEETERQLLLDLLAGEKEKTQRYRIIGTQFDYNFLGAKKTYNALANFKALVKDIVSGSPKIQLNRGGRQLISGGPATDLAYSSVTDLEQEMRWLWSLATLGF